MKQGKREHDAGQQSEGQRICATCGKPELPEDQAGDLGAHLFQSNYCSCHAQIGKTQGGRRSIINRLGRKEKTSPRGESEADFCPKCGLKIARSSLPGSLTGYLFQDVRCKCVPEAEFKQGAMAAKLRILRQNQLGTTFNPQDGSREKSSTETIGLAEGAIIGGAYRIGRRIGVGGMGEVYEATRLSLTTRCALKVLPPEQVTESGWMRFQQEARTIARLDHLNLVRVLDLGIHEGCLPFYAMDFIEGDTLAELLARHGPMPLNTAIDIFEQVCDGVEHAHRAGVIHRDLKPANIMVSSPSNRPRVKVLDFGLAKLTQQGRHQQSLTAVGDIFGSPFYMSPEQCSGEKLDNRSDIYSIGCTLFECLTGQPPFTGHNASAIMFGHEKGEPPTLASIAGKKAPPDAMEVVIAKLLRKNPVERYQTMGELKGDLLRVRQGESVRPFYVSRSKPASQGQSGSTNDATDSFPTSSKTKRNKVTTFLVITGMGTALLILATLAFLKLRGLPQVAPGPPKTATGQPTKIQAGKSAAAMGSDDFDLQLKDADKNLNTMFGFEMATPNSLQKEAPKSATDTTPFCQMVVKDNQKSRVFTFPTDAIIGDISGANQENWTMATGKFVFPADSDVSLSCFAVLADYPAYYKRFRTGDIYRLYVSGLTKLNSIIHSWKKFPEFSHTPGIKIFSTDKLDRESLDILQSDGALRELYCNALQIDMDDLIRFPQLMQLTRLAVQKFENLKPLLQKLQGSNQLSVLSIGNSAIDQQDLKLIARLPALHELTFKECSLEGENLNCLSNAKHLTNLHLDARVALEPDVIDALKSIPSLRGLSIDFGTAVPDLSKYRKIYKAIPRLRLYATSP